VEELARNRTAAARVNRHLAKYHNGLKMCKTRGARWRHELGDYFIYDPTINAMIFTHVNPEEIIKIVNHIESGVSQVWRETKAKAKRERVSFELTKKDVFDLLFRDLSFLAEQRAAQAG
jgi:hypothetical protein